MGKLAIMNHIIITIIIIIIIIFNIYIAQIKIQEDMIKCPVQLKLNPKLLLLIYNFEFTRKCEELYYVKH